MECSSDGAPLLCSYHECKFPHSVNMWMLALVARQLKLTVNNIGFIVASKGRGDHVFSMLARTPHPVRIAIFFVDILVSNSVSTCLQFTFPPVVNLALAAFHCVCISHNY